MDQAFSDIILLLSGETLDRKLPVASVFGGVFLPEHKLQLHFISLSHPEINAIPPSYFAQLSEDASQQNIRIIHLWSDIYAANKKLAEARILSLIGQRTRIHARQTTVVRLDKKQTDTFLNAYHLQQSTSAYYKYGLVYNDELVAVATFSKSRVMNDGIVPYRSYELIRFASKQGTTVTGGLGKLLRYFINNHHPAHLMTYADRDWSAGAGYEKLGFTLAESTPPQVYYIQPGELIRYPLHRLPEHLTEAELQAKGYISICNAGNLKYIKDLRK